MAPIETYTDEEINEIIFKIGDIIMDIELGFMLLAAHSMLGDAHPTTDDEPKESKSL
jgi:hypothetical protein